MDKHILGQWLAAGYMEEGRVYPTEAGTPQGGIASPVLANMVLDGLDAVAQKAARNQKINVIRYADDFVITGVSKEILEQQVRLAVVAFLRELGLELSDEKTRVTHIDEGFDFLGFNIRKYHGKLLIKPSKASVKRFLEAIRALIKTNASGTTEQVFRQLNSKLRGWANYYRHVVSKATFNYVDAQVFKALMAWVKRRHPNKSAQWRKQHYFRSDGLRQWVFYSLIRNKSGARTTLDLFNAASVPIVRHVKIQAKATPYDPTYIVYFAQRALLRKASRLTWEGMNAIA
jgi:RNA-directed DNA polymerase